MPMDRFIIAPFEAGLETDVKPFLIPDDAFALLRNAYVFRGRVRKRFGSTLMGYGWTTLETAPLYSRFSVQVATTDGTGAASGNVPGAIFKVGQMFSIGNEIFTVQATGTPVVMLTTGASTTHTYNTTNGVYNFAGTDINTPVYFYPAEPVMGLDIYQVGPINSQPSYGFDTQFAYVFSGGFWQRSQSGGNPVFHGNDTNFFWTTTWRGVTPNLKSMFVTNFNATVGAPGVNDDPMWVFDGTIWTNFSNVTIFLTAGDYVQTARLIVPFKNRLLLLNTIEQDAGHAANKSYVNRCRYSHNGSPFANNAWLEPNNTNGGATADGAGFIDAPTEEAIISAEFIKDRLIVFFERSTWEIVYTGNQLLPFVWQKINTELGADAQQSSVPFDKAILTVGNTGIHSCNGANVARVDVKIPQVVFGIRDANLGPQRVAGIRDYFVEMVYWAFPSDNQASTQKYPNQVLVYNYQNDSWAINDDSITAFGYYEQQVSETWENTTTTWETTLNTWASGANQAEFRQVIAGNQQGYVFIVNPNVSRNAPVLQISNMTYNSTNRTVNLTIVDHNLVAGDYVYIENAQGVTFSGYGIYRVINVVSANVVTVGFFSTFTGTYVGGGTAARVSNYQIVSKQWNPYIGEDRNLYLSKIDFYVAKTGAGEVTVDYSPSSTNLSMIQEAAVTNMLMGTGVLETSPYALYPLEQEQERLWHPVYFQTDGQCIQITIYMAEDQITVPSIALSDLQINAMTLYTTRTSDRMN